MVPQESGFPLARLLVERLGTVSLEQARALIEAGGVYLGSSRVRVPSRRVAAGDRVTVYSEATAPPPETLPPLVFAYRDEDFVIVHKPAGVPVAATRERADGTLAEQLRITLQQEGMVRPYVGVVHRLDQGATGLVLFTIRTALNRSLHQMFAEHRIVRSYRVRVHGSAPTHVHCTLPLRERPHGRGMEVASEQDPQAITAETDLVRIEPSVEIPGTSLLAVTLVTGRMHQIRVHCASLGHPVIGDTRYGDANLDGRTNIDERANLDGRTNIDERASMDGRTGEGRTPLHLHAWRLELTHPRTQQELRVDAELPAWARGESPNLS